MAKSQRIVVIQHEQRVPLGQFERTLHGRCEVIAAHLGQPIPESSGDVAGLIVLGAAIGVRDTDKAPWLPAVTALIQDALQHQVPTLGLCLGAQLLAEAAGGHVSLGNAGGEVGASHVELTNEAGTDPYASLLGETLGQRFIVAQSHYDAITTLPPHSTLLASSALYPHQLFRVGANAWGTQYHPEVTPEWFADWMAADAETLAEQGSSPEQACRHYREHADQLQAVADQHANAFLRVLDQ